MKMYLSDYIFGFACHNAGLYRNIHAKHAEFRPLCK